MIFHRNKENENIDYRCYIGTSEILYVIHKMISTINYFLPLNFWSSLHCTLEKNKPKNGLGRDPQDLEQV